MGLPQELVNKFYYEIPGCSDDRPVEPERFTAVDGNRPHEVDDASLVRRDQENGLYVVKTAVADCTDICLLDDDEMDRALHMRRTRYFSFPSKFAGRPPITHSKSMYPGWFVNERSLKEGVLNPAIVTTMHYAPGEEPELISILPSFVRVARKTFREYNNQLLAEDPEAEKMAAPRLVREMLEAEGIASVTPRSMFDKGRDFSQILVAQTMIMTNSVIARWASDLCVPFVNRAATITEDGVGQCDDVDPLEEMFQSALTPNRIQGRAFYTHLRLPHELMGLELYAHTSSPLRRLVDAAMQLQVADAIFGEEPRFDQLDVELLAEHCNSR